MEEINETTSSTTNPAKSAADLEPKIQFKKPILVGRIGKLPKKASDTEKTLPENESKTSTNQEKTPTDKPTPKCSLPPAMLLKEMTTPIPYKEPKWIGLCPEGSAYALEVLKCGVIVEKIDLTTKPYYVFGRLANCDVVAAHPTLSRHHAVLQYKAVADEGEQPSGWYLQDLGSTHGTYLNKARIKPHHHTRVRVGHQINFGTSTRSYIMVGPDFDCEEESEMTVSEIKQRSLEMKRERERMIQEAIDQREKDRLEEERKKEEQGIDWGMGEDAEDEPDLSENPFAVTTNEELYLNDPKKTLRGYFEREGHELSYDCEERGVGQFICRVELPLDDARGRPLVAEVLHRGKKKEAVVACALEACRILDRAGLLRQAKHESRGRKRRDWSADDYYDSDEDTFLDRTGAVERKRDLRRRRGTHGEGAREALTYDGLLKQIKDIESRIADEERNLHNLRNANKPSDVAPSDEGDSLDTYIQTLGRETMGQKALISTSKMTIQKLKMELSKTQRLADIARPAHLPALIKKDDLPKTGIKIGNNSVIYGKRPRLKNDSKISKSQPVSRKPDEEFVEEVDTDEEENDTESSRSTAEPLRSNATSSRSYTEDTESSVIKETESKEINVADKRVFGPMRPPENYVIPESYFNEESDRDLPEIIEKD